MTEQHTEYDPPPNIADRDVGLTAVLKKIRYDLTACQAKLSEAMRMVAQLDLDEGAGARIACPKCDVKLAGPRTLAEHQHVMHDGPIPDHWAAADALVGSRAGAQDPPRKAGG